MPLEEIRYPLSMFSTAHIIFVSLVVPAAFFARFIAGKFGFTRNVLWVCMIIGIVCEIEKILFFMVEYPPGVFRLPPNHLPFNMCPFQLILLFILLFAENPLKKEKLLAFMYPSMIAGGFIGIMIPAGIIDFHGLLDIGTYRYVLFHILIVFAGFYLYFSKPIHFGIKSYGIAVFGLVVMAIISVWVNAFFGWDPAVNHMFFASQPVAGLPVFNTEQGWSIYILQMALAALVMFTGLFMPGIIKDIKTFIKRK